MVQSTPTTRDEAPISIADHGARNPISHMQVSGTPRLTTAGAHVAFANGSRGPLSHEDGFAL
ncbi:hypothetical protein B5P19_08655 [Clavibacter sepedonicus]|nr:hypothetical protein B5P19_08655 [Clavibacter sepedonicus]OQJ54424.1 hypothetical protein B5P20_10125 [Clavibacter sepedonicus]